MRITIIGLGLVASTAFAQEPPRSARARVLSGEQHLAELELFGGALEAEVEAASVDYTVPAFLNGLPVEGAADLHFEVQLRYAAARVLGGRNAGEFVPYQKVHVTIVNTSTASADTRAEFDLAPHVGRAEGWHYASNVRLPPADGTDDPFNDTYHVTITLELTRAINLHVDSVPASRLFQMGKPLTLFDGDVVFGSITALPVGDVATQLARAQALTDISTALGGDDFSGATTTFAAVLEALVTSRLDAAGYDGARGLTSGELADLLPNIAAALAQSAVGPDCYAGAVIPAECKEWVKKGLERFFYLSVLHEVDEALADMAAGELDAVDGAAHKWDEAWAYYQALKSTAGKRQANCDDGRFGTPIACGMDASLEAALLAGANAILASAGTGLGAAVSTVEAKLLQIAYLGVVHEIIAMREKVIAADTAGYNKARVEARGFYRTIAYLVPAATDALLTAALTNRTADLAQSDAAALVTTLNDALDTSLTAAELADAGVVP